MTRDSRRSQSVQSQILVCFDRVVQRLLNFCFVRHKRQEEDLLNDLGKKRRLVSRIVQRMHDLALQKL